MMYNQEEAKLLAEFMGYEYMKIPYWHKAIHPLIPYWVRNAKRKTTTVSKVGKERFHNDWNWIMGVVDKIIRLRPKEPKKWCRPYFRTFGQGDVREGEENMFLFRINGQELFRAETIIEGMYKCCVDFVETYKPELYE